MYKGISIIKEKDCQPKPNGKRRAETTNKIVSSRGATNGTPRAYSGPTFGRVPSLKLTPPKMATAERLPLTRFPSKPTQSYAI